MSTRNDTCFPDTTLFRPWSDELLVKPGQVGEITVAGPPAPDAYFDRDAQTRLAKIREESALTPTLARKREREQKPSPACGRGLGEGASAASGSTRIVHRMGDLGYFDADGRLWFCGRKSQRVVTAT